LESKLFDWDDWIQHDTMVFGFYDATLKVQIGEHSVGAEFPEIVMDYEEGLIRLYKSTEDEDPETFRLELNVRG
jgi:hypothetical protein